jgi:hypothetical protein
MKTTKKNFRLVHGNVPSNDKLYELKIYVTLKKKLN